MLDHSDRCLLTDQGKLRRKIHTKGGQTIRRIAIDLRIFGQYKSRACLETQVVGRKKVETDADRVTLRAGFKKLVVRIRREWLLPGFGVMEDQSVGRTGIEKIEADTGLGVDAAAAMYVDFKLQRQGPVIGTKSAVIHQVIGHQLLVFQAFPGLAGIDIVFIFMEDLPSETDGESETVHGHFQLQSGDQARFEAAGQLVHIETHFRAGHKEREVFLGGSEISGTAKGEKKYDFLHIEHFRNCFNTPCRAKRPAF